MEVAANGKEALQALERRRPDLVLTDAVMPIMDGIALCREIRSRADLILL